MLSEAFTKAVFLEKSILLYHERAGFEAAVFVSFFILTPPLLYYIAESRQQHLLDGYPYHGQRYEGSGCLHTFCRNGFGRLQGLLLRVPEPGERSKSVPSRPQYSMPTCHCSSWSWCRRTAAAGWGRSELPDKAPFYVELMGSTDKTKYMLGIPYEGTQVLTTFSQRSALSWNKARHCPCNSHRHPEKLPPPPPQ